MMKHLCQPLFDFRRTLAMVSIEPFGFTHLCALSTLLLRDRLVIDRKIHRIRNIAKFVRPLVECLGLLGGAGDSNMRTKRHADETAVACVTLLHGADRSIFVRHDNDSGVGAEMKVPEHVTARKR